MRPSRKYLSLPIISLSEGQHIGYVKNLVLNSKSKSLAALVVDPKGFFKEQRIIPYSKVISVGDDAITIDKGSYVEKSTNLPEMLELLKEKSNLIGSKVVTETGKTLGIIEEYHIDPENGQIMQIEISGGKIEGFFNGKALLSAEHIVTIGQDIIIVQKGSEADLNLTDKGLTDTLKSVIHSTGQFASGTSQSVGKLFKKEKTSDPASSAFESFPADLKEEENLKEQEIKTADAETPSQVTEDSASKEPLG